MKKRKWEIEKTVALNTFALTFLLPPGAREAVIELSRTRVGGVTPAPTDAGLDILNLPRTPRETPVLDSQI